jgi:thiosulfate dehydrogenase [quinone] large subunit
MTLLQSNRETAYALLRITLGTIFLTTGLVKFSMGISNFAGGLEQQFAGKLPQPIVAVFAHLLPFVEVTVGALLLLGLFNLITLVVTWLLLIVLTFGKVVENDAATVAHNLIYVLIAFVLLWFTEYNRYSLDFVRQRSSQRRQDSR